MNEIKYIAHHGIQGQKWGQQNGPPYPLNSKISSAVKSGVDKIKNRDWEKTIENGKKTVVSGVIGGLTWGAIPVAVATVASGGILAPAALGIAFAGGFLAESGSTYIRNKIDQKKQKENDSEENQNG